jgi:putative flippase GtrA
MELGTVGSRARRFAVVGALGIGVQLLVLHTLASGLGVPYLIATVIAVASAVIHNFAWHRRWTWRDRPDDGVGTAFVRFALANGAVSLGGNILVMALLVSVISVPLVAANAIAIGVCGVLNFYLADTVVFIRS